MEIGEIPEQDVIPKQEILRENQIIEDAFDLFATVCTEQNLGLKHSKDELVKQACRFAESFKIDPTFFLQETGFTRPFLLLGIADKWLSIDEMDLEKRKHLIGYIKTLVSNDHIVDKQHGESMSRKVIELGKAGYQPYYEYASGVYSETNVSDQFGEDKRLFAEADINLDQVKTDALLASCSFENEQSPLKVVREKLHVTEDTEWNVAMRVSKYSTNEMIERFDGVMAFQDGGSLYLPNDYTSQLLEHEYIHTQQQAFFFGAGQVLGTGLSEAFTESQTSAPEVYSSQREMLEVLLSGSDKIRESLVEYGRHPTIHGIDEVCWHIMSTFGIDSALDVLAVSPTDNKKIDESRQYRGDQIYTNVHDTTEKLKSQTPNSDIVKLWRITIEERFIDLYDKIDDLEK